MQNYSQTGTPRSNLTVHTNDKQRQKCAALAAALKLVHIAKLYVRKFSFLQSWFWTIESVDYFQFFSANKPPAQQFRLFLPSVNRVREQEDVYVSQTVMLATYQLI